MTFEDRFTSRADAYAAGRPSYPEASIDALLLGHGDPAALVVAELGAGTGISARLLADRGPHVLAIEPNAAMREAALRHPRVEWYAGTAERTTLADRSVDIVTAFQAWHWFDRAIATAEARRIVRPGGTLAIVYNERDESDPVTAAFGAVVRRYALDETERSRVDALADALAIDPARTTQNDFRHAHELDRAGLHARAASSSYLPQRGLRAAAMHAEIDAFFDRFAARDAMRLHLLTSVVRIEL